METNIIALLLKMLMKPLCVLFLRQMHVYMIILNIDAITLQDVSDRDDEEQTGDYNGAGSRSASRSRS